MTKQELQSYYWVRRNIQKLEDRLLELETQATKQTTTLKNDADSRHGGVAHDKVADMAIAIVELKTQIAEQIGLAWSEHYRIEKAIEKLPEREKYLIRARYIDSRSWEQIAVDMGYSWRQVHYIHADALKLLS